MDDAKFSESEENIKASHEAKQRGAKTRYSRNMLCDTQGSWAQENIGNKSSEKCKVKSVNVDPWGYLQEMYSSFG